jgi:hypothetical protein
MLYNPKIMISHEQKGEKSLLENLATKKTFSPIKFSECMPEILMSLVAAQVITERREIIINIDGKNSILIPDKVLTDVINLPMDKLEIALGDIAKLMRGSSEIILREVSPFSSN